MSSIHFAFAGFRHGHVFSLYERIRNTPGLNIAAACEPDSDARRAAEGKGVIFTHSSYEAMFDVPEINVVVIGEAFGNRANVMLSALAHGKHVLSDKPVCISLPELDAVEAALRSSGLVLGCMFDLRTTPAMRTAKRLIHSGAIGRILGVQFNGMHPLNYGVRPGWYFEPGMQGGTINDLAVHAFDCLPYLTGLEIGKTLYAHTGNTLFPEHPAFQNSAQLLFELENTACVSGDVSYFSPSGAAFSLPCYWRFTIAGTDGLLEFNCPEPNVLLARNGMTEFEKIPPDPAGPDYLDSFLAELRGETIPDGVTTRSILTASRCALMAQAASEVR